MIMSGTWSRRLWAAISSGGKSGAGEEEACVSNGGSKQTEKGYIPDRLVVE